MGTVIVGHLGALFVCCGDGIMRRPRRGIEGDREHDAPADVGVARWDLAEHLDIDARREGDRGFARLAHGFGPLRSALAATSASRAFFGMVIPSARHFRACSRHSARFILRTMLDAT
jgi:hypothetical protein